MITGLQEHHLEVHAKTLEHMETIAPLILGHIRGHSGAIPYRNVACVLHTYLLPSCMY